MITEIKNRLDRHDTKIKTNREEVEKIGDRIDDHDTGIEKNHTLIAELYNRVDDGVCQATCRIFS